MKKYLFLLFLLFINFSYAQKFLNKSKKANHWVDSIYNSLTTQQKIAQLMVIRAHSNLGQDHIDKVSTLIKKYNVGGLCFFQGGPIRQANLTNYYQQISKTPLMICIDAEWGLGMRLDSVISFPKNLTLGSLTDENLIYKIGNEIGKQCKRIGVHVNFAPVVDVNNNANNPVINDRSFGERENDVANFGVQYMNGLQDAGVMACAKHFPGHGDVEVDSHLDLPIINKSIQELENVEIVPFKRLIKNDVGSVMMAHLYIPSIDTTSNLATSLSKNAVKCYLKKELNFKGLSFTDALEMKGVSKFFPNGESSVQSLIAGNDILCLPEDVELSIIKIDTALANGKICKKDFEISVKKMLLAKYNLGLHEVTIIDTTNLLHDLNATTNTLITEVANNALTIVKWTNNTLLPLHSFHAPLDVLPTVAFVNIGNNVQNEFKRRIVDDWYADTFNLNLSATKGIKETIEPQPGMFITDDKMKLLTAKNILDSVLYLKKYDVIILSVQNYNRKPANNFGIGDASVYLMKELSKNTKTISFFFGNPYAIKNVCDGANIVACYDENDIFQSKAADFLQGKIQTKGKLPVTVCY